MLEIEQDVLVESSKVKLPEGASRNSEQLADEQVVVGYEELEMAT